jgi:hypothetical protein
MENALSKNKNPLTKTGKICSVKKTRSVKMEKPLSSKKSQFGKKILSVEMGYPLSKNEKHTR